MRLNCLWKFLVLAFLGVFLLSLFGCASSKPNETSKITVDNLDKASGSKALLSQDERIWKIIDSGKNATIAYAPGSINKDKEGNLSLFIRYLPTNPKSKAMILTIELSRKKGFFSDDYKFRFLEKIVFDLKGNIVGVDPESNGWMSISDVDDKDARANFEKLFNEMIPYFDAEIIHQKDVSQQGNNESQSGNKLAAQSTIPQQGIYEGSDDSNHFVVNIKGSSLSSLDMTSQQKKKTTLFFNTKNLKNNGTGVYKFPVMPASTEPVGEITLKINDDGSMNLSIDVKASQRSNIDAFRNDNVILNKKR